MLLAETPLDDNYAAGKLGHYDVGAIRAWYEAKKSRRSANMLALRLRSLNRWIEEL